MKRTILAAALLLAGALGAQADTDIWSDMAKHARGDDVMRAASNACEQQVGRNLNGVPTSRQFKRCMARYGWRFEYTRREHTRREHTWIDPDTGLRCRNEGIATVCSNYD